MKKISSVRLTVPKATSGEIVRGSLVDRILKSCTRFTYICAGAGYGKTTLLSQLARNFEHTVWVTFVGESDVFTFVDTLCEAIRQSFPEYSFSTSEYIPFMHNNNFTVTLANAVIASIEYLSGEYMLIFDDIHTLKCNQIKEFVACFMRYAPENVRICLSSREAPWPELSPLRVRGGILELNQSMLAFTREESACLFGFDNDEIYKITEGWPLAVSSFRILLENGVSPENVLLHGNETLYSYLFYECVSCLPDSMIDFLNDSASFEELDAPMLDAVLERKNSSLILESLVRRNLFTIKTDGNHFRYHALFKKSLLDYGKNERHHVLWKRAAQYYLNNDDYSRSAEYAILNHDKPMLEKIILAGYRDMLKSGYFNELRLWFLELDDGPAAEKPEIYVAKGAYLSCIGNFTGAQKYLDAAVPLLSRDSELYIEAMIHKARVIRNIVSFKASTMILDRLIAEMNSFASETAYIVAIEKLYNLCLNSQIIEAFTFARQCAEDCARAGNLKLKAWYERYFCTVYFFSGNMRKSVFFYEKSLAIPEDEREFLDMHGIDIFAAKAYQMMGDRDRSINILNNALQKMRSKGKYEELWYGYMFAAEIHYQNASIDRSNGIEASYDTTNKYFALAAEYAPLFRKTDFQLQCAKVQQLTYGLMFTENPKREAVDEIYANIEKCGSHQASAFYARMMGCFAGINDNENSIKCAKLCIKVGISSGIHLYPSLAYGVLARYAISEGNANDALLYVRQYLHICEKNGIYEYFRARKDYDPILQFAVENDIEPEAIKHISEFSGFRTKKAYIKTFGGFGVFSYSDRKCELRLRTRKERELLAFLLDVGETGATKEQMYDAIWSDSESDNIKKLIGVNLAQIKKDLSGLNIENPVVCSSKRYILQRNEIVCDYELFEAAANSIEAAGSFENIKKLLSVYSGEYLSDFEAFWAEAKRIHYRKLFNSCLNLTDNKII